MGISQSNDSKGISPNNSPVISASPTKPHPLPIPKSTKYKENHHEVNVMMSPPNSPSRQYNPYGSLGFAPPAELVPTVFTWTGGGKDVYITGTFNNWKEKIPLNMSEKDFTIIQNLPPGVYQYKFVVDGKWVHAQDQSISTDMKGNVNNFVEIKPRDHTDDIDTKPVQSGSPPGSYGTVFPENEFQKTTPPALPPHLRRALLNTTPSSEDPTLLPLPHHVMLNHLYSLPKREDNVTILGVTHRYKTKFVTTVLYKPFESEKPSVRIEGGDFVEDIEL